MHDPVNANVVRGDGLDDQVSALDQPPDHYSPACRNRGSTFWVGSELEATRADIKHKPFGGERIFRLDMLRDLFEFPH